MSQISRKMLTKDRSIFRYLLFPMLLLVIIEVAILVGSLAAGGIFTRLDQNAKDIVDQRVITRSRYLENEMLNSWSNLSELTDYINGTATKLEAQGQLDFATLDRSSADAIPLILEVTDELIATMRSHHVTGAYLILNTQDLDTGLADKPGIYIRDLDPQSQASMANGDLLIERAPAEVVRSLNISTDSSWWPRFEFQRRNEAYYDFFYHPYQQALHDEKGFSATDLGYWGQAVTLYGDDKEVITYSLPLINEQGQVYGVVGIDITLNYLNKLLPSSELMENSAGSYLLAVNRNDDLALQNVFVNGSDYQPEAATTMLRKTGDDYYISTSNGMLYSTLQELDIYNSNTPYSNQKWMLIGAVNTVDLFAFTAKMGSILSVAILVMFLAGLGGSLVNSYIISKPIKHLSDEVEASNNNASLSLGRTHITEIDQLASGMERLNQKVRDTALKFSTILQMASIKMAGFEYNGETGELFLSDNFFEIFLDSETDPYALQIEAFQEKMESYAPYIVAEDYAKKEYLFQLPDGDDVVFINLRLVFDGNIYTGVVEDVTDTILERKVIEYERDHDTLTGLLNRRAFIRRMDELFTTRVDELKIAALLMLDLDNLKFVNDTYGHEFGDSYIQKAAETFQLYTPEQTVISRISGDEFFIFFYGYDSEDAIEPLIAALKDALMNASIPLPDQKVYRVKASGGVAWYPRNSDSFERLQHYADFAMYEVKRSSKGDLIEFNMDNYLLDSSLTERKKELNTLIEKEAVQFYFQPIVDSHTGEIFACESLLRSFLPKLKNPLDILRLAKEEGRLGDIEILTWFHAMKAYVNHIQGGNLKADCKLFVNSISNQILPEERVVELEECYKDYLPNVVMEITEGEMMDESYHRRKEEWMRRWGSDLALDDYGNGYNGERVLLFIAPKYVKVDMEIIRNINSNPDKCKIVENIVSYAHERDMKVIAEGIETIDELKQVVQLNVDYLQGYLLAKPQLLPPTIPEDVVKLIQNLQDGKNS